MLLVYVIMKEDFRRLRRAVQNPGVQDILSEEEVTKPFAEVLQGRTDLLRRFYVSE